MTCRSHREVILDLARGVATPAAVEDAVVAHIETCAACAAELARQRALTRALSALSADVDAHEAPAGLEKRLLAVFPTGQQAAPENAGRSVGAAWWLGAAAAVAVMAGGVWVARNLLPAEAPQAAVGSSGAAPAVALGDAADRSNARPQPPAYAPATAGRPALAHAGGPPKAGSSGSVKRPKRPRSTWSPLPRPIRDIEFVAIPAAVGLPPLESATIVRTELPLSALPDYGLQISSNAAHATVQADLLVGQDGVPRGIRLVSALEDQVTRSRQ